MFPTFKSHTSKSDISLKMIHYLIDMHDHQFKEEITECSRYVHAINPVTTRSTGEFVHNVVISHYLTFEPIFKRAEGGQLWVCSGWCSGFISRHHGTWWASMWAHQCLLALLQGLLKYRTRVQQWLLEESTDAIPSFAPNTFQPLLCRVLCRFLSLNVGCFVFL